MTGDDYPGMSKARHEIMIGLLGNAKSVLDVGDVNQSMLAKKLKKKHDVVTIDIRPGADIKANLEKGIKVKKKFDAIIAGEVLEHVYHLRPLLKDFKRLLKSKGRLVISVPNVCNLKSRVKMIIGKLPTYCADADDIDRDIGGHIRDFNESKIKSILQEAGFKVITVKSGGLWFKDKPVITPRLCRPSIGDTIIISAEK